MVHHNHQVSERGSKLFKDTDTKDYLGKNYDRAKKWLMWKTEQSIQLWKAKNPQQTIYEKKNMFAIKVKK